MNRRDALVGFAAIGLYGGRASIGHGAQQKRPAGKWPDVSNTGVPADARLAPSGALTLADPGAIVEALDIEGTVDIDASHVTMRHCRVRAGAFSVVRIKKGAVGVTIEDCEIDGVGVGNDGCNGIQGSGLFQRNNIHHVENGVTPDGAGPTTIADNYIHDLLASGSPHYDCIQIDGGVADVVIRHNTAINDYPQTSAVMIDNEFGPISNILVEGNLLVGGGYTIYVDGQFNANAFTNVRIVDNHMGRGRWGVTDFNRTAPVFEGNVLDGRLQMQSLRRAIKASEAK